MEKLGTTEGKPSQKDIPKRKENSIFTIWVHAGYIILVISMISWMIYIEYLI